MSSRSYRILTGPTAAGKTQYLLHRAQHTPLVVLSADSRQVYRLLDIGTGKATTEEQQRLTHFGLNLLNLSEKISVFLYLSYTREWLSELNSYKGEVWFCGGTGLYLRAVLEGLPLGDPPRPELRPWLETGIARLGGSELSRELGLTLADPANPRRVLRALEAHAAAPEGMAEIERLIGPQPEFANSVESKQDEKSTKDGMDSAHEQLIASQGWSCAGVYVLDPGKAELERRIEGRVKAMFHGGLLEEVAELKRLGYGDVDVVREGIGYREALAVLAGELTLAAAVARAVIRTRQYAKRQRTYFRGMGWPFYTEAELPR